MMTYSNEWGDTPPVYSVSVAKWSEPDGISIEIPMLDSANLNEAIDMISKCQSLLWWHEGYSFFFETGRRYVIFWRRGSMDSIGLFVDWRADNPYLPAEFNRAYLLPMAQLSCALDDPNFFELPQVIQHDLIANRFRAFGDVPNNV